MPTQEVIRCRWLAGTAKWKNRRGLLSRKKDTAGGRGRVLFLQLEDKRESQRTLPGLLLLATLRMKQKS